MKKYQKILLFIVIGFVALPTITLGSTFVSALIQGKSVPEAIQILAEQVDNLLGRVAVLETKQTETDESIIKTQLEIERLRLENENLKLQADNIENQAKIIVNKQECDNLSKKMPDKRGYDNWGYTPTITSLYERAEKLLNSGLSWDSEANMKLVREVYEEAKPLYEAYIIKCGQN